MSSTSLATMSSQNDCAWNCGEGNRRTPAVSCYYRPFTSSVAGLTSMSPILLSNVHVLKIQVDSGVEQKGKASGLSRPRVPVFFHLHVWVGLWFLYYFSANESIQFVLLRLVLALLHLLSKCYSLNQTCLNGAEYVLCSYSHVLDQPSLVPWPSRRTLALQRPIPISGMCTKKGDSCSRHWTTTSMQSV